MPFDYSNNATDDTLTAAEREAHRKVMAYFGRKGGSAKSPAKTAACRENAKRPRNRKNKKGRQV